MRLLLTHIGILLLGSVLGYFVYPVLNAKTEAQAKNSLAPQPLASVQSFAQCDFTSEQIDRLADRITPHFMARLSRAGINIDSADIKHKSSQEELVANNKIKAEQQLAFTQANQVVDQMISNRKVSSGGMAEALQILQQSGQSDQAYKLMIKVSAAVNSGELTLEQAGYPTPSPATTSR
jgi:multidrug resistance efflux pump